MADHCGRSARVIPACAGNTGGRPPAHADRAGHPRVRGEHQLSADDAKSSFGSSPRARGTHGTVVVDSLDWLGHPRVRGEHRRADAPTAHTSGSSPRARGTHCVHDHGAELVRVIPACAGNTATAPLRARRLTGHPRVRGEHLPKLHDCARCGGSSPRARGTLGVGLVAGRRLRVIPACAGNTPLHAGSRRSTSGHPRVRGEHSWPCAARRRGHGSSPRARGTRSRSARTLSICRVIPACAGNTRKHVKSKSMDSGHPRVRGEH